MKKLRIVGVREAKSKLSEIIESAQKDLVIVTKSGRPFVVILGVEGQSIAKLLIRFGWARQ